MVEVYPYCQVTKTRLLRKTKTEYRFLPIHHRKMSHPLVGETVQLDNHSVNINSRKPTGQNSINIDFTLFDRVINHQNLDST